MHLATSPSSAVPQTSCAVPITSPVGRGRALLCGRGNEAQVQALDAGHCLIALTAEVFCTVKAHVYCLATTLPTFLYLSSLLWLTRDIGHGWPVILICVSGAARRASCARPTVDSGKHCRDCLTMRTRSGNSAHHAGETLGCNGHGGRHDTARHRDWWQRRRRGHRRR